MKKGAIVRLVLWSVTAMILISVMVLGIIFSGSISKNLNIPSGFNIGFSGLSYKNADEYSIGNASITDTVDSVEINWVSGSVKIEVYDGDTVELNETSVSDEDDMMRYRVNNGTLTVQMKKSGVGFGIFNSDKKDLSIKLPRRALQNLKLDCTSADISISGVEVVKKLEIDTVSGKTEIDTVSTDAFDFDSVSGGTDAAEFTVKRVSVSTISGDVWLDGAIGELELDTTSGALTLKSSIMPKSIETDSISGDVRLTLPEDESGFTAELDSISGDFNCNFPVTANRDKRIYGNGSARFEFDSTSGDVTINHE